MAFRNVEACLSEGREKHAFVADLDGILTRGRSSFPYFMLMATKGGSILRGAVLMLVVLIMWLLYHFVSEETGIKADGGISLIPTVRLTRNREKDAANIKRLLEAGHLGICPEGTTSREPVLLHFSALFAELLEQIVSVAVLPKMSVFHANTMHGCKAFVPALRGYLFGAATARADICRREVAPANCIQKILAATLFQCTTFTAATSTSCSPKATALSTSETLTHSAFHSSPSSLCII
ncbi:hypothetical protein L7F22_016895 [Adiantum nelumboides]|nr:hypothetical protein [Adiantum nelumboides]